MPLKVTFFFTQKTYGWSESFYANREDIGLAPVPNAVSMAKARAAMLGNEGRVSYVRFATTGAQPHQVHIERLGTWADGGIVGRETQPSDHPDTALLLRFQNAAQTRHKLLYCRGQPDELVEAGGLYSPKAYWGAAGAEWLRWIKINEFGWFSRGARTRGNISAIDVQPSGQIRYTMAAPFFLDGLVGANLQVNVKSVRGATNVNGTQIVTVISTTIAESLRPIPTFPYSGGGTMSYYAAAFNLIDTFKTVRAVERKAGRPSYQSPGRRRVRRVG